MCLTIFFMALENHFLLFSCSVLLHECTYSGSTCIILIFLPSFSCNQLLPATSRSVYWLVVNLPSLIYVNTYKCFISTLFPSLLNSSEVLCICSDLCCMQLCSQVLNRYMHFSCTSLLLLDTCKSHAFPAVPVAFVHVERFLIFLGNMNNAFCQVKKSPKLIFPYGL